MARGLAAVLSIAIALAVFEIGSCTRCYQCNSQSDPSCGDPFTPTARTGVVDCSITNVDVFNRGTLSLVFPAGFQSALTSTVGAPKYCHKIVMNTGTVVRTCLDAHPGDVTAVCKSLDKTLVKYCKACEKDLCNGAGGIFLSTPMALLALVASYLFYLQ